MNIVYTNYYYRSDVAGQLLPLFGKDWTHIGVVRIMFVSHNITHVIVLYMSKSSCDVDSLHSVQLQWEKLWR